jgi:hypothetical protein
LPATTVGSPGAPGAWPFAGCSGDALARSRPSTQYRRVAEKRELLRRAGFEAWQAGDETAG